MPTTDSTPEQEEYRSSQIPRFCLLLHENEPLRPSGTAPLIKSCLPDTLSFIWQRKEIDSEFLRLLDDPQYQPYLIFPADRPGTQHRAVNKLISSDRRPLFIIPDGTWKEVRKIVRKSPYLDQLPMLSLAPDSSTEYRLRRNPDRDHLCTSEIAELLLKPFQPKLSFALQQALQQFQFDYYQTQD